MKVAPISLSDLNGNWRASEPKNVKHSGVEFNTIEFYHLPTNTRFYVNSEYGDDLIMIYLYNNMQEYKLLDTSSSILYTLQRALVKLNVDFKPLNYKSIVERLGSIRDDIAQGFTVNILDTFDDSKLEAVNALEKIDVLIAQIIEENKNSDEW